MVVERTLGLSSAKQYSVLELEHELGKEQLTLGSSAPAPAPAAPAPAAPAPAV